MAKAMAKSNMLGNYKQSTLTPVTINVQLQLRRRSSSRSSRRRCRRRCRRRLLGLNLFACAAFDELPTE